MTLGLHCCHLLVGSWEVGLVANHGCVDVVCSQTCNVQHMVAIKRRSNDGTRVQVYILLFIMFYLFYYVCFFLKGTTPPNVVHQREPHTGNPGQRV